jgi:molybdate transport system permease protein
VIGPVCPDVLAFRFMRTSRLVTAPARALLGATVGFVLWVVILAAAALGPTDAVAEAPPRPPDRAPIAPLMQPTQLANAPAQPEGHARPDDPLLVFAASSLTSTLPAIVRTWEQRTGRAVEISFGGSSRLARQIRGGAPADLFLSADRQWVAALAKEGHVATRRVFLSNRLVWVVPAGRSAAPRSLAAVSERPPSMLALGSPSVPAGAYARTALRRAGLWPVLADRTVAAASVRRALQWVVRGEAPAGVVYATDAASTKRVDIAFAFPDSLQPAILYEGAVLQPAPSADARRLLRYLTSPTAQHSFQAAGFAAAPDSLASRSPAPPADAGARRGVARTDSAATRLAGGGAVAPGAAVWLSLKVGLGCTLLGAVPAVLLAWLLARRDFVGKAALATLCIAPLALPPVVTGFVLLRLVGREGLLGPVLSALGLPMAFTSLGAGLAAFVVSFPLFLLTARSAIGVVDRRYEEVAQTLGSPPRRSFLRVTLPLALPGIAAGGLLAFARAVGEFGATAVLAGNVPGRTQTIPLAIYTLLEMPGMADTLWALVGISLGLAFVAATGYEAFRRRLLSTST